MNKENMLKWAEALESGEYRQHIGSYGDGESEGYCCLHVAYRLFEGHNIDWNDERFNVDAFHITNTLRDHLYPKLQTDTYAGLNDIEQLSFNQIAQVIREKVKNAEA